MQILIASFLFLATFAVQAKETSFLCLTDAESYTEMGFVGVLDGDKITTGQYSVNVKTWDKVKRDYVVVKRGFSVTDLPVDPTYKPKKEKYKGYRWFVLIDGDYQTENLYDNNKIWILLPPAQTIEKAKETFAAVMRYSDDYNDDVGGQSNLNCLK